MCRHPHPHPHHHPHPHPHHHHHRPHPSAADLWALGCLLYTLCYSCHPFTDATQLQIVNANVRYHPTAPGGQPVNAAALAIMQALLQQQVLSSANYPVRWRHAHSPPLPSLPLRCSPSCAPPLPSSKRQCSMPSRALQQQRCCPSHPLHLLPPPLTTFLHPCRPTAPSRTTRLPFPHLRLARKHPHQQRWRRRSTTRSSSPMPHQRPHLVSHRPPSGRISTATTRSRHRCRRSHTQPPRQCLRLLLPV